ncbi:MAG: ATP-dependent Clp protease adaptor ClpS [Phycisphaerales bacterium]
MNATENTEDKPAQAAVAEPPAREERKAAASPPKVEQLPPFKVLLHNDDVNTFDHVIRAIVMLTPHDARRARQLTLEAHDTGLALLVVTHKERAELYAEQFRSLKLVVTVEPA